MQGDMEFEMERLTRDAAEDGETKPAAVAAGVGSLPAACFLICLIELCERFAFYGISGPLQNYVQHGPDDHPRGVLGKGAAAASTALYLFQFWCYCTPLIGAYVADTYLGRYRTVVALAVVYMVGIVVLVMAASTTSTGLFAAALAVIGAGAGGVKANVLPLVADQVQPEQYLSVFLAFYFCINVGLLGAIVTTTVEARLGFQAAFAGPLVAFAVSITVLLLGRHLYIKTPPSKSTVKHTFGVVGRMLARQPVESPAWSAEFAQSVVATVHACAIFLYFPIYWLVFGQMFLACVAQAAQMELHGIPNDLLQNIDPITVLVAMPVVGVLSKRFPIRDVAKIQIGFYVCAVAMAYACMLQHLVDHFKVHVLWQVPVYVLIGISEVFASVTGLEYAYKHAPLSMKSLCVSLFLTTTAGGSAIGVVWSAVGMGADSMRVASFGCLGVAVAVAGFFLGRN